MIGCRVSVGSRRDSYSRVRRFDSGLCNYSLMLQRFSSTVERMAPNHDIRVRFLEPLFAEISADFFSYIPLRAAPCGASAPVAELEYASDLKSEDFLS